MILAFLLWYVAFFPGLRDHESAVKPLRQIFFFVGMKQGWLKSKDTFLRVVVLSYSVPIGPFSVRWEHQPKGNCFIISHKIKNNVAIRHFPV